MKPACTWFDSLDKLCDKATASEVTHVEIKQAQRQQQQQRQHKQKKHPTDSSCKGGKRGYRPSIYDPAHTSGSGQFWQLWSNRHAKSGGGGQKSGLPPAPWVSKENFEGRCSTGKCSQCRTLNQKASFCHKYSWGGNPPQEYQTLAPNRDVGHQMRKQKSFHKKQPKNSLACFSIWPDGRGSTRRNFWCRLWQCRLW